MKVDAYVHFIVKSAGEIPEEGGYICYENSIFDPSEFTEIVHCKPRKSWKFGEEIVDHINNKDFVNTARSSTWLSERITGVGDDVYQIIDKLLDMFEPHVDGLIAFSKKYNVYYEIEFILYKVGLDSSGLFLDSRCIEFCHKTGTEIAIQTMLAGDEGFDLDYKSFS